MLLKALILASILALATCQSGSSCSSTSFSFYNGYGISGGYGEQYWDWQGADFSDGTSDTFDDYFYLDLIIDNVTYSISNFYRSPVDYYCDVGTTDWNSTSYASYTYNITDTIQIFREFYAPRSTTWLRVLDTVRNFGAAVNIAMTYYGNYGSDSSTTFAALNDYYWVSSDGANGADDPPFSVNAASYGGQIIPTKLAGEFITGNDDTSYTYDFAIPAGEARSIMIVLGQWGNLSDALDGARQIDLLPDLVYSNISVPLESIVNWGMCAVQFEVVDPQTTYCTTPMPITFTVYADASISFNGSPVTVSNQQFTADVVNGSSKISYQRQIADCAAKTASFDFKLPSANLSVSIDNSGTLPKVSTTGGYGTYEYTWKFSSGGDLTAAFGGKATVTVTDMEGCAASAQIDVPQMPQLSGNTPGSTKLTSSASQVIASFVGLIGLAIAL